MTVDDCTGIGDESKLEEVIVYPNPARDVLHIAFDTEKNTDYTLSIYNLVGQQVYISEDRSQGTKEIKQINLGTLPNGIYFIKLKHASNKFYKGKIEKFN